jgi:hypothetical protein
MTEEEQNATFDFGDDFLQKQKETHWTRDKNLRDVLVLLYEQHQLLLNWISVNRNGEQNLFCPNRITGKHIPQ